MERVNSPTVWCLHFLCVNEIAKLELLHDPQYYTTMQRRSGSRVGVCAMSEVTQRTSMMLARGSALYSAGPLSLRIRGVRISSWCAEGPSAAGRPRRAR